MGCCYVNSMPFTGEGSLKRTSMKFSILARQHLLFFLVSFHKDLCPSSSLSQESLDSVQYKLAPLIFQKSLNVPVSQTCQPCSCLRHLQCFFLLLGKLFSQISAELLTFQHFGSMQKRNFCSSGSSQSLITTHFVSRYEFLPNVSLCSCFHIHISVGFWVYCLSYILEHAVTGAMVDATTIMC